ncbi:protein kinase [Streptomyces prasinopilosus]|uniref:Protein kinase domain-containing protein n=1 Tax=Streptomyces prasinopilosus TaxID=67344 RepID=A0A1G6P0H5_9ACTN|nr:protein kinase [Streptomyces prasinopilosus]SDC73712.1 Protein kinase domain-containing protein [Streptomyces prasinopilosus]
MDEYAGRVLADRYRLPLPPSDEYELTETRAFDTYSGQEVLVRQVPLPEVVEAEVLDAEGLPDGFTARDGNARRTGGRTADRAGTRRPTDPVVRRAVEAAQAAAAIPDHPRLDQVFDVFAEGGSLWIVSELVAARPLAALLAERPLTPYRAAEVAADVLMAVRVLHGHGWVHRNITPRTVLVCDDGRVMLTGLAVGAAEEALCGYDPVPAPDTFLPATASPGTVVPGTAVPGAGSAAGALGPVAPTGTGVPAQAPRRTPSWPPGFTADPDPDPPHGSGAAPRFGTGQGPGPGSNPDAVRRAAIEARAGRLPGGGPADPGHGASAPEPPRTADSAGDVRAARAGAIAAYRAGARAAARVQEAQRSGRTALPGAASDTGDGGPAALAPHTEGASGTPDGSGAGAVPPGLIADPYGVEATGWHGAAPRGVPTAEPEAGSPRSPGGSGRESRNGGGGADGHGRTALPPGGYAPAPALGPATGGPGPDAAAPPGGAAPAAGWDASAAHASAPRGPATALAAERARQARMAVVGPVTERWAPEQAGPVHENWQLAAPIGPATDLWALGALLFRAVQGHAPYPEESTAELVQMVCAEPAAFAEECGPLRPVVESLLRQDPTERLDFEELRGWLRSLVRSAPEPEAGVHVIAAPPVDASRLPIVRRRGELVRRRRAGLPAHHGRHKRAKRESESPRRLGRTLLLLVLLAMAAAIAYAVMFLPKAGEETGSAGAGDRTGTVGTTGEASPSQGAGGAPEPGDSPAQPRDPKSPEGGTGESGTADETQTTGPDVPEGFTLREDPEGFRVAVAKGWQRTGKNGSGQVLYSSGDFELIVVPGRDSAAQYGDDPMAYQRDDERELQPYRDSSWATSTGLKTIEVGGRAMAEGQFTWTGDSGELYIRNLAALIDGRYHVLQVRGPAGERDEVTRLFEQASASYRFTG